MRYDAAWLVVIICLSVPCVHADDATPATESVAASLARFSTTWQASDWQKSFRGINGYIRRDDDVQWKVRFFALRDAVRAGQAAVGPLMSMLRQGGPEERVFAAQALAYLAPQSVADELLSIANTSDLPGVRLYCVDALAPLGERSRAIDWQQLADGQTDRDVRKHISYAMQRDGQPVAASQLSLLKSFRDNIAGTAAVGQPAPDFRLPTIDGRSVQLSENRGKKPVVLVFIYGDT